MKFIKFYSGRIIKRILSACLAVSLGGTSAFINTGISDMEKVQAASVKVHYVRELTESQEFSMSESLEETVNPYRGFYKAVCLSYKKGNGNSGYDFSGYSDSLVHLRIDISDFSAHTGVNDGHDSDCFINSETTNMLEALRASLQNLRDNNATAVVRIAYDKNYSGFTKDTEVTENGKKVMKKKTVFEPSIDTALQHQQAIGSVFAEFPDVIASVECGVFGPWGEMHSSSLMTDDNLKAVINKWLEVLPENETISVRQPEHYRIWSGVTLDSMPQDITTPDSDAYRVGVYNDGYLGSYDDRGTFDDREKEVSWLEKQARHTLYGGEIVLWYDAGIATEVKNNALYMEKEGFRTHTSYLNIGWNDQVIKDMRDTAFAGKDSLYANGTTSELDYVRNHLGYRYVVRNVKLTKETSKYENFGLEAEIENVGFANLIKEKKAYLIIKGKDDISDSGKFEKIYDLSALDPAINEKADNIDPRNWNSGEKVDLGINVDLPDDMEVGNYLVYIKFVTEDKNHSEYGSYPIRFSNDYDYIFDDTLEANYLGSFSVVYGEPEQENGSEGQENSSGGQGNNSEGQENGSGGQGNNSEGKEGGSGNKNDSGSNNKFGNKNDSGSNNSGDKSFYSNEWINGKWYNADGSQTYEGTMSWNCNSTGWWIEDSSGWYPTSQWQKIDGKWYYFTETGYMDYSEYRDGCWLGADGAWIEEYAGGHWCCNKSGWWYEDQSGWYPVSQYLWIDGIKYYFNEEGYME